VHDVHFQDCLDLVQVTPFDPGIVFAQHMYLGRGDAG
jgi:hypothetical protein